MKAGRGREQQGIADCMLRDLYTEVNTIVHKGDPNNGVDRARPPFGDVGCMA